MQIVSKLRFRMGVPTNEQFLDLEPGPMVVLVGPNNSGKSLALREIHDMARRPDEAVGKIVASFETSVFDPAELERALEPFRHTGAPPDVRNYRSPVTGYSSSTGLNALHNPLEARRLVGNLLVANLDGARRLQLLAPQGAQDLLEPPGNVIQTLFVSDDLRRRFQRVVHDAFGVYPIIDATGQVHLRVRVSKTLPAVEMERSLSDAAIRFHRAAKPIEEMSDGYKAFIGMTAYLLASPTALLLIDEPEAFLHPPLAQRFGKLIAQTMQQRDATCVVATHSAEFLMGAVEADVPVSVVRLSYDQDIGAAKLIPPALMLENMREPLARSTNFLSALFHRAAVVTEGDVDRAFYQEINQRVLAASDGSVGCTDTRFLNAQNKQTIYKLVGPLRQAGVPAVAVVDIDFLKEGGLPFTSLLRAANVPQLQVEALGTMRSRLKAAFEKTGKDMKRDGGEGVLSPADA